MVCCASSEWEYAGERGNGDSSDEFDDFLAGALERLRLLAQMSLPYLGSHRSVDTIILGARMLQVSSYMDFPGVAGLFREQELSNMR